PEADDEVVAVIPIAENGIQRGEVVAVTFDDAPTATKRRSHRGRVDPDGGRWGGDGHDRLHDRPSVGALVPAGQPSLHPSEPRLDLHRTFCRRLAWFLTTGGGGSRHPVSGGVKGGTVWWAWCSFPTVER